MGMRAVDERGHKYERLTTLELQLECLKRGVIVKGVDYLSLKELFELVSSRPLQEMYETYSTLFTSALGSSHNHQAWIGGYTHHIVESLNILRWLYSSSPRRLPFTLKDAMMVMFLHDIEKPFKAEFGPTWRTKEDRRNFRKNLIQQNEIALSRTQWNALEYVEGEHDYSNKERMMGEMAALCHCADILSARLWHNKGKEQNW